MTSKDKALFDALLTFLADDGNPDTVSDAYLEAKNHDLHGGWVDELAVESGIDRRAFQELLTPTLENGLMPAVLAARLAGQLLRVAEVTA